MANLTELEQKNKKTGVFIEFNKVISIEGLARKCNNYVFEHNLNHTTFGRDDWQLYVLLRCKTNFDFIEKYWWDIYTKVRNIVSKYGIVVFYPEQLLLFKDSYLDFINENFIVKGINGIENGRKL